MSVEKVPGGGRETLRPRKVTGSIERWSVGPVTGSREKGVRVNPTTNCESTSVIFWEVECLTG